MKVLIADDDLTSLHILKILLEKWSYQPIPVANGGKAWEIMQQENAPKLVVLDWIMPIMDGLEVCNKIRQIVTSEPAYIIMLTSRDETADIVAALNLGANDYIIKPYNHEELRARLGVGQRMIELQSELVAAKNKLAHMAAYDALTNILNRGAILEMLNKEIARAKRKGEFIGIALLDIDFFKKVNDSYGHQAGDDILKGVTKRIQAHLRKYDIIGRYGGEEFLIITPSLKGLSDIDLYERLRKTLVAEPIDSRIEKLIVTASIGVTVTRGELNADQMLAVADHALYQAKATGRNCVVFEEAVIFEQIIN